MHSHFHSLTKYRSGSIAELCSIAWPMIVSSATGCLMIFGDRLVLAHYSQDAFNANIGAISWYWAFLYTFLNIISIAEVFVGQFNGAKEYHKIGSVVWQMVWASCSLWVLMIPIAIWGVPLMLAKNLEVLGNPYLQITFLFLPVNCAAFGAMQAFFVGLGKTKIVSCVTLLSNVLNILLDIWFVFGWGFVPEMGIKGAAWATGISQCVAFLIFFVLFFQKKHYEIYKIKKISFDFALFKKCLHIGTPNAVNCFINCFGWAAISQILAIHVSENDFTAFGIATSIHIMFFFLIDGTGKGVSIICSNAIGSGKLNVVGQNLRSSFLLLSMFAAVAFVGMILYPHFLIHIFLPSDSVTPIVYLTKLMLIWTWVLFCTEGLEYNFTSMLTAAGDTKFPMFVCICSFWCLTLLPTYVLVTKFNFGAIILLQLVSLDCLIRACFFYSRYLSGKWRSSKITGKK